MELPLFVQLLALLMVLAAGSIILWAAARGASKAKRKPLKYSGLQKVRKSLRKKSKSKKKSLKKSKRGKKKKKRKKK